MQAMAGLGEAAGLRGGAIGMAVFGVVATFTPSLDGSLRAVFVAAEVGAEWRVQPERGVNRMAHQFLEKLMGAFRRVIPGVELRLDRRIARTSSVADCVRACAAGTAVAHP